MGEYPEYHEQGMGCGLEDQNIIDRYEACRYGYETALEDVNNDIVEPLEKENKRLREKWENLEKWMKDTKINFTGDDRFWRGYDSFHGDVRAKMKELEKGGE